MSLKWDLAKYLAEVAPLVVKAEDALLERAFWRDLETAGTKLSTSMTQYLRLFTPKVNSVHWAMAVNTLIGEITFAIANMQANVRLYRRRISKKSRPAHVHGPASFYASDAVLRVDACRHKMALMLHALEEPLDPNDRRLPGFEGSLKLLKGRASQSPVAKKAAAILKGLDDSNFSLVKKYRDLAAHRANPRVEIYGAAPHHDFPHVVPVRTSADLQEFTRELTVLYPDAPSRTKVFDGCKIGGTLYRRKKADRVVSYRDLERALLICLPTLTRCYSKALAVCLEELEKERKKTIS